MVTLGHTNDENYTQAPAWITQINVKNMSSSTEFWHLIIRHVLGKLNGGWRKIFTKYSTILLLLQKHGVTK